MRSIPEAPPAPPSAPGSGRRAGARRRRSAYQLVKKVHLYLGLLNLTNLLIFGITGLVATAADGEFRPPPIVAARSEAFTVPAGLTDKEIADRVYEALRLPLTNPVPGWAIRHDAAGHLELNFYTVNGPNRVTVVPEEGRLQIESRRNGLGRFLGNLHATTMRATHEDWRMRLWTYNIEFALWSLLAMAGTGVYLWLASRPRNRLAVNSIVAGNAIFVLLYILTR